MVRGFDTLTIQSENHKPYFNYTKKLSSKQRMTSSPKTKLFIRVLTNKRLSLFHYFTKPINRVKVNKTLFFD